MIDQTPAELRTLLSASTAHCIYILQTLALCIINAKLKAQSLDVLNRIASMGIFVRKKRKKQHHGELKLNLFISQNCIDVAGMTKSYV